MNNQLEGTNVMPMKSQTSINENSFSMMRSLFQRTPKDIHSNTTEKRGKNALYQDSSLYIQKKKMIAIGKQHYDSPLKFNSNPKNDSIQAKRRIRSSGSVMPKKFSQ
jgi:hypothetical protein